MSTSPSSMNVSRKSRKRPWMLRKCTLKIFLRVPNQRITSKISRPGSWSISETVPWQKFSPWYGLSRMETKRFRPSTLPEHRLHAPVALARRHPGVLRMAGEAHLVLLGDRDDALEEVVDPIPVEVGGDGARFRERGLLAGLGVGERAVLRAPAPLRGLGPNDAQERQVVLERGDARLRRVADHPADVVDGALALRAPGEQDARVLGSGDGVGAHRQREHVEVDAERLDALAQLPKRLHRPASRRAASTAGPRRCCRRRGRRGR